MQVKSKSGRVFDVPTASQEAAIRTGIAADVDAYELSDIEMNELRPMSNSKISDVVRMSKVQKSSDVRKSSNKHLSVS